MELAPIVMDLFPMNKAMQGVLAQLEAVIPNLGTALVLFAVVPAICEEVAFRGYILSGLEAGHRRWTAIVLSAVLFGLLHVLMSLFQQLFNATLLGLVLGWMAIRTRSLFPGIVFHLTNNALAVLGPNLAPSWIYRDSATHRYEWPWVLLGLVGSLALLFVLSRVGSEGKPTADEDDPTLLAGASAGGELRAPDPSDRRA